MIQLEECTLTYGNNKVLNEITLKIEPNEKIVLLGKSGSGKTTLLNLVANLLEPTSGYVRNNAKNYSMIFQDYGLFPWQNVKTNVELALISMNLDKKSSQNKVSESLKRVGLSSYESRYPSTLSGGEKQRLAIARAIVSNPELLLVDEATSSLDTQNSEVIQNLLKEIGEGCTQVIVTHNIEEAIFLGTRIIIVDRGNIVYDGKNGVYELKNARDDIKFYEACVSLRRIFNEKTT